MKSIAELNKLKENALKEMNAVELSGRGAKVLVGMATCGIAAGAKPVMDAFLSETGKRNLKDIEIKQTGCIGICQFEPIVEIYMPGKEKVTYINVSPDKVPRIVAEHLANQNPIVEYTVGYKHN